ncbi:MAG: tetratricopeptide repeat protein [Planctomycetota bacterium]
MRNITVLSALLISGALASAGSTDLAPALKKAEGHLKAGQRGEAITLLRQLTTEHPGELEAHLRYQEVMAGAGRLSDLRDHYGDLLKEAPQDPVRRMLALRLDEGRKTTRQLLRLTRDHPEFAPGFVAYANALRREGRLKKARKASMRAIELDANSAWAHDADGWILDRQGDLPGAARRYRRAIELRPCFLPPRFRLAHLQVRGPKPDAKAALKLLAEAQSIAPKDPRTFVHRGILLGRLERDRDATQEYERALRLHPEDPMVLLLLGETYSDLSEWALATKAVEQAMRIDENLADAHAALGYIHFRQERYEDAIDCYREAARREPKEGRHQYYLGLLHERWGKVRPAVSHYRRAVLKDPENAAYRLALGAALEQHGRASEAVRAYRDAVRKLPDDVDLWIRLGHAHAAQRKHKNAYKAWKEALRLAPAEPEVLLCLGIVCDTELRDRESAIDYYERYLKAGGKDARVREWLDALRK